MRALWTLTLANIRSYIRDRAALFWTLAFPLIFIVMFGLIFQGGESRLNLAWVNEDGSTESGELRTALADASGVSLEDFAREDALAKMRTGEVDAVVIVPAGYGGQLATNAGSETPGPPAVVAVYTDPSRQELQGAVYQVLGSVLAVINMNDRPPLVIPQPETIQTENLNFISYFVPSMLGLSVMQVGIFAAIPLVADREKLILKRLAATPLRRWQLVGSNVLMRLLIALAQAVIIVAVGSIFFGVEISGSLALTAFFVILGSVTFLALGYVIASFASTEDAANGMTSVVQFPMMFLSGTFFPRFLMPEWLQNVSNFIPLTPAVDGIRLIATEGKGLLEILPQIGILGAWLLVIYIIAFRVFRWE
jgi:ABC-2 type transport system permease protein